MMQNLPTKSFICSLQGYNYYLFKPSTGNNFTLMKDDIPIADIILLEYASWKSTNETACEITDYAVYMHLDAYERIALKEAFKFISAKYGV